MSDEETTGQRLDRELGELLQELRVVLPGVQVLLAFLLTAAVAAVLFGWFWYALPLLGRSPSDAKAEDRDSRGAADRSV